ncbi:MAG: zonular occludens toxin domain-containing protein [Zhongshania sp.]|uniref:zonular occludens toxin domain-containing protein n=1 Tax=Zhongshania sp. TaxID=1971902 RepID=UPI0026360E25|nr:zonular occludens toxin domain-containing protein [Zhongshania sp.]MDF1693087.1 zonular occludens toxin domain-containing protein [Zhongshania sp.]
MSITAYVGLPGHGKSYGVVENVIAPALKAGIPVYTNIPMNDDVCVKKFGYSVIPFQTQDIIDNEHWWTEVFEAGAVLVIDELWRLWPAGLKATQVRETDKTFLAEHRHFVGKNGRSTEIVLVTQGLNQVAAFTRDLVETTFVVTKMTKFGMAKKFRVDIYSGAVKIPYPVSRRDSYLAGSFKQDIYDLYVSHTKSSSGVGDETRVDDRFSVFKSIGFKFGVGFLLIMLVCIYYGAPSVMKLLGRGESTLDAGVKAAQEFQTAPSRAPVPPASRLVSLAEKFVITSNWGPKFNIEYKFKLTFPDSESKISAFELRKLGYTIESINRCLARVSGPDFHGIVACERAEPEKGFIEDTLSPV